MLENPFPAAASAAAVTLLQGALAVAFGIGTSQWYHFVALASVFLECFSPLEADFMKFKSRIFTAYVFVACRTQAAGLYVVLGGSHALGLSGSPVVTREIWVCDSQRRKPVVEDATCAL